MAQSNAGGGPSDGDADKVAVETPQDDGGRQSIQGVIAPIPGEVSADEKAAARRSFNALRQIGIRAAPIEGETDAPPDSADRGRAKRTRTARRWTPYADGDSNIPIPLMRRDGVKIDDILGKALEPVGYRRVEKLTYRAVWSTPDVEHMLRFDTYGNPKQFLSADAGLRNNEAEAFAKQCEVRYANPMSLQPTDPSAFWNSPWFCLMHFSAGELLQWGARGALDLAGLSSERIAEIVASGLSTKLAPFVGEIQTVASLLAFLEGDARPLLWVMRGPYYRAALVAYLAAKLDRPRDQTAALLRQHALAIANGIDRSRFTPEAYIEHILDDAAAAVAPGAA